MGPLSDLSCWDSSLCGQEWDATPPPTTSMSTAKGSESDAPCSMAGGAQGSQREEGALRRAVKEETRVHWRQESRLCKGTEVWEGRVWCLKEQRNKGAVPKAGEVGKGWPRSLHSGDLSGPWPWDPCLSHG